MALGLGVFAIVAVGVVGFALVGRGSPPGSSPSAQAGNSGAVAAGSPRASRTEEPFPTLLESSLILSLPEASGPACTRGDAALLPTQQGPSVKPWAHVVCDMLGGTGPEVIEAWLLPPTDFFDGGDVIAVLAADAGIAEGVCVAGDRSYGSWGEGTGAYLCDLGADAGGALLVWSRDDARTLYRATTTSGSDVDLYDWWLSNRLAIAP